MNEDRRVAHKRQACENYLDSVKFWDILYDYVGSYKPSQKEQVKQTIVDMILPMHIAWLEESTRLIAEEKVQSLHEEMDTLETWRRADEAAEEGRASHDPE